MHFLHVRLQFECEVCPVEGLQSGAFLEESGEARFTDLEPDASLAALRLVRRDAKTMRRP